MRFGSRKPVLSKPVLTRLGTFLILTVSAASDRLPSPRSSTPERARRPGVRSHRARPCPPTKWSSALSHCARAVVLLLVLLSGCSSISDLLATDGSGPGRATDTQVQKLPDALRVEFSKEGRSISGYVYNLSGRNPTHMQLRVEGVDAAGKIVTVTRWWIPDIPQNGRAFFQVTVPDAPAYRIIVESFNWHKGN